MSRAPELQLGVDAVIAPVHGVVCGAQHHVKARGNLGIANLLRPVEDGVARKPQRGASQDGLLVDNGKVTGGNFVAHVGKEVREVIRAVRHASGVVDRRVKKDVAYHADVDGRGCGGRGCPGVSVHP
jgi:hypothetical protein